MEFRICIEKLKKFFPLWRAGSWDNVGLLIAPLHPRPVQRVLLCNDLTLAVAAEAVQQDVQLVCSYHPPLFLKFNRLVAENDPKQHLALFCVENGLAVFSQHTASDEMAGGVNDFLARACCKPDGKNGSGGAGAQKLSQLLDDYRAIVPGHVPEGKTDDAEYNAAGVRGAGRLFAFKTPVSLNEVVARLKKRLHLSHVLVALGRGRDPNQADIRTVALSAGSGQSVLQNAPDADLWITGEMSHHEVLDAAERGRSVICTLHSNSERAYIKQQLPSQLAAVFGPNVEFIVSRADKDPFQFC